MMPVFQDRHAGKDTGMTNFYDRLNHLANQEVELRANIQKMKSRSYIFQSAFIQPFSLGEGLFFVYWISSP